MPDVSNREIFAKTIALMGATFALVVFLDYKVYSTIDTPERRLDKWKPKKEDVNVYFGNMRDNKVNNRNPKRKLEQESLTLDNSRIGETRRINVFQTVAPSVVFIDTFQEVAVGGATNEDGDKKAGDGNTKGTWISKWRKNHNQQSNTKVYDMKNLKVIRERKQARLRKTIASNLVLPKGSGTGFVWDDEGHIVTNNHVVDGAKVVEVSILTKKDVNDENSKLYPTSLLGRDPGIDEYHWRVAKAKVIGTDPGSDIAVIKIDAPTFDIHPVEKGDDRKVMVGADCLAIGNPYGLDHTLSRGIISAKGRVSHSTSGIPMTDLLQTDASMNPGNSGGPLLNADGQVIGMNTFIMSGSKASAGVGFAIPISKISKIANILIDKGTVSRPNFGIVFNMGVQAGLGSVVPKGVLISQVLDDGKKTLLKGTAMGLDGSISLGDIIVSINGISVDSDLDIYSILDYFKPGDEVNLKILRLDRVNGKQGLVAKQVIVTV